ncbi:MAG: AAA family ATPase [Candidatus Kapabacteria bacterium]|nr:AAA family ATPase [Candidatus Kapabacteria bacterium]
MAKTTTKKTVAKRTARKPHGAAKAASAPKRRVSHHAELKPDQLRWKCDHRHFAFKSTAELEPLKGIVGQHRAIEAIRMGAEISSRGYNIFVMSLLGTGRMTTVQSVLQRVASHHKNYCDYAYVNNFKNPDMPRLLKFKAGEAKKFAKRMDESIALLRRKIPQLFEEAKFRKSRNELIKTYRAQEQSLLEEFDAQIRPAGFALGTLTGEDGTAQQEIFPLIEGAPVQVDALDGLVKEGKLTEKKALALKKKYISLRDGLVDMARKAMHVAQEFRKVLIEHDKAASSTTIRAAFLDERARYADAKIIEYLNEVENDLLDNIELFSPAHSDDSIETELTNGQNITEKLLHYSVNVILDNSMTSQAPIVVETSPSYMNLFGTVEKKYDKNGFMKTDFTQIKAGSLLRADGGYLIVNASDIVADANVWQGLKRLLLYGRLEIQAQDGISITGATLKPELIESNVKVIMLGDYHVYTILSEVEEDFNKIFKVAAEFDYETDRGEKMLQNYARFVAKICAEEQLPHASPTGVAAIVEWGVERTEDKNKLSINFSEVADVIREAAYFARANNKRLIDRPTVEQALTMRRRRTELQDEKIKNQIQQGTLLIDTSGSRVGQINGLTVYSTGLVSFGQPARITVTTGAGNAGIVNIEREAEFSGNIHTKGVMIITGLLRELFAQRRPLALSASIAFEQSYGGVDGDSASAAEIYALLSSLANIPIKQNIAVTGSVNQKGDIQPVGGVNEKIKGYYDVCRQRGLDGSHGVILPVQNVADLMLDYSIVESVRKGEFHVYPIARFEEGIRLLMDIEAGTIDNNYTYPQDTLFRLVDERLDHLYRVAWRSELKL